MGNNAEDAAYEAARQKYYYDVDALMKLFHVWRDYCEWVAEKKGDAYVATELKGGFSVWAKSQRELVETLREMGINISRVKLAWRN